MIAAALRYFGIIFALGFVLGTIRTLWLAPIVGTVGAVLIELPIMLIASWLVARTGNPLAPAWYVAAACAVSLIPVIWLRDRTGEAIG